MADPGQSLAPGAIELSFFEKERERLLNEITEEFEQALASTNTLNRRIEEVVGVGKEFRTIAALWDQFSRIVKEGAEGLDAAEELAEEGASGQRG